jgi:glycogen debranching enzyme
MMRATLENGLRYAWRGTSLLVTNARGECGPDQPLSGFFFREARHVRDLRLTLNGDSPWPCVGGQAGADGLEFVFVYPELVPGANGGQAPRGAGGSGQAGDEIERDGRGILRRALELVLTYRVDPAGLDVTARLHNRSAEPVALDVDWWLGADFQDLLTALNTTLPAESGVTREFRGHALLLSSPASDLGTGVQVSGPVGWSATDRGLATRLELAPRQDVTLALRVMPQDQDGVPAGPELHDRQRAVQDWLEARTRVFGANGGRESLFARITDGAMEDLGSLALLHGQEDEWLTPAAGMPIYPALFGRDAITAAWQAASLDRATMLDATLTRLRRLQGAVHDPARDEQPGRIVQQVRLGPLARAGRTPFARYYGDVASPLLFVLSLGHLVVWTGDRERLRRHWDAARRVLDWARTWGDRDHDGYIEYHTAAPDGPKHQGWKDSGDAIVYPDGRPVPTPIAAAEIQGYWYAALQVGAVLAWMLGERQDARAFWREARELKQRFNRDFWMAREQSPALALDPEKRQVASVGSNGGHCLACGILTTPHVRATAGRLFAPDMFSGWGIRTLSSQHPAYNPVSYHLGSIWPVENATIVFGLRRYGLNARALDLASALFDLAALFDGRIPECVGGYPRGAVAHPGAYPRANAPQAWNQSAFPFLLQSLLGLQPLAPWRVLVVDPVLPPWLPEVTLEHLRVGDATVTIRFRRTRRGRATFRVLRRHGRVHVLRQPPPESLSATPLARLRALAAGSIRR